jgi:hypothetical protein
LDKKESKLCAIRPAREAQILRRLHENHKGDFPINVLTKIWREMFGALTQLQKNFSMAVYMQERGSGYLEIARDHFGSYTDFIVCGSISMVIKEVLDDKACVGIIPVFDEEEEEKKNQTWWFNLISDKEQTPKIVAKLPFNGPGKGRGDDKEAYVLSKVPNERTQNDRSLVVVETKEQVSISFLRELFIKQELNIYKLSGIKELGGVYACLIEIEDFVDMNDERIKKILKTKQIMRTIILGNYAKTFKD